LCLFLISSMHRLKNSRRIRKRVLKVYFS
jgi:hypothetical protein